MDVFLNFCNIKIIFSSNACFLLAVPTFSELLKEVESPYEVSKEVKRHYDKRVQRPLNC